MFAVEFPIQSLAPWGSSSNGLPLTRPVRRSSSNGLRFYPIRGRPGTPLGRPPPPTTGKRKTRQHAHATGSRGCGRSEKSGGFALPVPRLSELMLPAALLSTWLCVSRPCCRGLPYKGRRPDNRSRPWRALFARKTSVQEPTLPPPPPSPHTHTHAHANGDAGRGRGMTTVHSVRVVLRGRNGRAGRKAKHCCSANSAAER